MNFVWLWIIVIYLLLGLRVINQYQRGVVLTLGKYSRTFSPGLKLIFVGFQTVINVDLRIVTIDIPQQEAITKDNVPVGINAVVYFRVKKAEDAVLNVENYRYAVSQYAMAALRDVIGGVELDELLTQREKLASDIKAIVEARTDEWGIDVVDIKIQDIELPADMKRAMAKQAESERERRAIVIKSQGEFQVAENLARAAEILKSVPGGISVRTLQTIEKLQPDPSKMTVFALPIEVLEGIKMINQNKEEKQ